MEYDDWDDEGYFYVRNKNDPLELHTKQVQKIFGAYSIHVRFFYTYFPTLL